ncbi:MAG: HAMP domain-containing protein, partial [Caldilineaceae bacterium]|nr:HAMP domain-containing protein [Caldilineaceae bacterium]
MVMRSIRWRLAASYVLLTLLIVILVGTATLWLVRASMERQEIAFLTANANSVARQVLPLWQASTVNGDATYATLLQLARTAAFLGNVRVKILDAGHNVLVDSGDPTSLNEFAWPLLPAPQNLTFSTVAAQLSTSDQFSAMEQMQPFILTSPVQAWFQRHMATAPPLSPAGGSAIWNEALPLPDMTRNTQESAHEMVIIRTFPSQWGSRIEFESPDIDGRMSPEAGPMTISSAANIFVPITRSTELGSAPAEAEQTAQPVAHTSEAFAEIPRSTRKVETPIGGQETTLGYVELSSGPDYGSPLLNTIWKAFAIAAGSVSLLAVLIGLVVGRGLTAPLLRLTTAAARMSRGDLSSRAAVQSRDEIGALAQQFNQMAMQLENSFAELATERDTLRRFMADASHELRT